jgi:cytochrome P450
MNIPNLLDPDFHATGEPHRVWAHMRAHAPLHRQVLSDGRAFWSVTRYEDACRVLGNHREFTSERGSLLTQLGHADVSAGRMLVATDPPRHGELRRPLNGRFSAKALARWEDRIRQAVLRFLAPGLNGGVWDLAARAYELPMMVAGALMGIPECDWPDLVRWSAMAAAPEEPDFCVASGTATLAIAHHQLFGYFARMLRTVSADNVVGHLMTMKAGAGRLAEEEIIYNCYSIILGANATTPHTISGTILALSEHPEQLRKVTENSALIPPLVEEGLRWTSPASSFLRHAVTDVDLSGGRVAAGDAVAVWIGSANRDENVFAHSSSFDVTRAENRHIAFGHGPHYCLGASLARLTFRVFFQEFFRRFERVEIVGTPQRLRSVFIAGFTHLPVKTQQVNS